MNLSLPATTHCVLSESEGYGADGVSSNVADVEVENSIDRVDTPNSGTLESRLGNGVIPSQARGYSVANLYGFVCVVWIRVVD